MTKTESKLLAEIGKNNQHGWLRGLGTDPKAPDWLDNKNKFIRRLHESGLIVWVDYKAKHGAGWALVSQADKFKD